MSDEASEVAGGTEGAGVEDTNQDGDARLDGTLIGEDARSYRVPSGSDVAAVAFGAWAIFTLLVAHVSFGAATLGGSDAYSALGSAVVGAGISSAFGLIATAIVGFPLGLLLSPLLRRAVLPVVHALAYSLLAWLICVVIWFLNDSRPEGLLWALLPAASTGGSWIIRWSDSRRERHDPERATTSKNSR